IDLYRAGDTGVLSIRTGLSLGNYVFSVAAGDLDGDGRPDLVASDYYPGGRLLFFKNLGGWAFAPPVQLVAGTAATEVAVGDLDGDDRLDVALVDSQSQRMNLFKGLGDGTVAPWTSFSLDGSPAGLILKDLDGDRRADLIVPLGPFVA